MGCLVAKCSLSNIALKECDDVYINLITETDKKQNYSFGHKLRSGTTEIELPTTYGGSSISSSCHQFTPIGILLKGQYVGWSSFEIDVEDKRTISNLYELANRLIYDYIRGDEVKFSVEEFSKLMHECKYQEAWKMLDEGISCNDHTIYYKNGADTPSKIYYNVISQQAFELITESSFQKQVYKDFIYGVPDEKIKTFSERMESIQPYINAVVAKYESYNINGEKLDDKELKFIIRHDLAKSLFEYCDIDDQELYIVSQKKVMDYSIFSERIRTGYIDNDDFSIIEYVLKDLILQHYINLVYHYFNVDFMPLSTVNLEEYDNYRTQRFNVFQSEVIYKFSSEYYEDCLFENKLVLVKKDVEEKFIVATYQNEKHNKYFFDHIRKNYSTDFEIIGEAENRELIVYDNENNVVYYEFEDTILDNYNLAMFTGE